MTDLRRGADEHLALATDLRDRLLPEIDALAGLLCERLAAGGRIWIFGNGGSAADAQHFATELLGHFVRDRRALPAVALTTDTSALTGIANDYDFDDVFARQVQGVATAGDVVIGISTSGESENVVRGLEAARGCGATTVALCGRAGRLARRADHAIAIPSDVTARIQEMHGLTIHLLCERIDDWASETSGG
ncbi:MAG TPA: SIS domain-containing protein [Candidatus Limnocylindria bacterium]|nr:SIS domain-containing protein [Candidatus Limnocylindria bacterium]